MNVEFSMTTTTVNSVLPETTEASHGKQTSREWIGNLKCRWNNLHVEYSGFYSLQKLLAFQVESSFQHRSRRAVAIIFAILPTAVLIIVMQLIPLQDPALGWKKNSGFFWRQSVRAIVIAVSCNVQVQELLPQLRHPWYQLLFLSFLQALPYFPAIIGISYIAGVFPVPFSSLAPTPFLVVVSLIIRRVFYHERLQRHTELQEQYQRSVTLTGFKFLVVFVYCGYDSIFTSVGTGPQIVLSFGLYIMKRWINMFVWKLAHIQDHHDNAAEFVSCSAHLFHALFSTVCLQTARSQWTFLVVLGLSIIQDCMSIRILHAASRSVAATANSSEAFGAEWTTDVFVGASTCGSSIMHLKSCYARYQIAKTRVAPMSEIASNQSKVKATFAVAQLLHVREVVLLRIFVDVFVAGFYLLYIGVVLAAPNNNRQYIPDLESFNLHDFVHLCGRLTILVATKVVALVFLMWLFRSFKQPSGMRQLAFILHAQWWTMQPLFFINVMQLLDFPLAHLGNDFSFRFEWIRSE